ncbi:MAG: ribosomal RNA small subunit methyltransferase A [Verrucomicrobia bacterium]|nr:ribosomal RNA small subunit methyltransferase A [Verrucomicrobiota bacterium]
MHQKKELLAFFNLHGLKAKRGLSQNFLIDQNIIKKVIQAAQLTPDEVVLEVGPGSGALTQELLAKGAFVFAVEKDETLARLLPPHPRLKVIVADILDLSLDFLPQKAKVVASLPFQITTPILTKLAPLHRQLISLILIIQEEVAHRYTEEAGAIALFLQLYAHLKILFKIPASSFFPSPKINGAVLQLDLHPPSLLSDEELFCAFLRQAFSQKRKMLRNTLKEPKLMEILERLSIRPDVRAEQLSLEQFIAIFEQLPPKTIPAAKPPLQTETGDRNA